MVVVVIVIGLIVVLVVTRNQAQSFRKHLVCFMSDVMMNDNFQEYDFSMESLLLRFNKPFHFCSKDTHITIL